MDGKIRGREPSEATLYGRVERANRGWAAWSARAAVAGMVAMLLFVLVSNLAFAAEKGGYWEIVTSVTGAVYKTTFIFYDEDGTKVDKIEYDGKTYDQKNGEYYAKSWGTTFDARELEEFNKGGKNAPNGYKLTKEYQPKTVSSDGDVKGGDTDGPTVDVDLDADGANEYDTKVISENQNPPWELSFNFVSNMARLFFWQIFRGLTDTFCSLSEWVLKVAGVSASGLFSLDFAAGSLSQFYAAAKAVCDHAVKPYAQAALMMFFIVWLAHATDSRIKRTGEDFGVQLMFGLAMLAVAATLISHAMDLCAGIYWLAQNLVVGVTQGLALVGISPGLAGVGIRDAFLDAQDKLVYNDFFLSFGIWLLSIFAVVACASCSISVVTTAFLRIGKIYIEAAASPLALSAVVDERSRRIGIAYMKGFAALCFQAAFIFMALGLAPLMFTVASSLIDPLVEGAGAISGFGDTLATLLPVAACVTSISGIVRAAEPISYRLFGVGA